MTKNISKTIKYLISAAIAILLLYFSFREVEWKDFAEGIQTCRWEFIILSMTAGIAAFWFRGLRWRQLLLPIDPSTRRITTFNAINIGYIANFIFPRIGEFVRCAVVTRRSATEKEESSNINRTYKLSDEMETDSAERKKASYDKVLGTVVLERGWDMLSMLTLMVVLLTARWDKFGNFFLVEMWNPISTRIEFSLWWIIAIIAAGMLASIYFIWHFRNRNMFCIKIWNLLTGVLQGFSSCFKMEGKWKFFASTALIWSMYWLMAASTMWAIPALDSLNIIDALFLSLAGSLGWLIPVPGGFGAFHFIVSLALQAIYGIQFEQGIIFATLSHESQAITMALFGGVSYGYESLKK